MYALEKPAYMYKLNTHFSDLERSAVDYDIPDTCRTVYYFHILFSCAKTVQ